MSIRRLSVPRWSENTLRVETQPYVRPADWPAMSDIPDGQQKFEGLYAVFDCAANPIAVQCDGNYTVDWGDGTATENVSSGVQAQHNYSYGASGLSAVTSRGYKIAKVVITPNGGNLTSVNVVKRHSTIHLYASSVPLAAWLDVRVTGEHITALSLSNRNLGTLAYSSLLEIVEVGTNSITDMSFFLATGHNLRLVTQMYTAAATTMTSAFDGCGRVQYLPPMNTSLVTAMNSALSYCYSLLACPIMDTHSVEDFSSMFVDCVSMRYAPRLDTSAGTLFDTMFEGCKFPDFPVMDLTQALSTGYMFFGCAIVRVPALDLPLVEACTGMFYGCSKLQRIEQLNAPLCIDFSELCLSCSNLEYVGSLDTSSGDSFGSMFQFCVSLRELPLFDTSNGTFFEYMLNECTSLRELPQFDLSSAETLIYMCFACKSLLAIPDIDFSNATNMYGAFGSCYSLKNIAGNFPSGRAPNNNNFIFSDCISVSKVTAVFNGDTILGPAALDGAALDVVYTNLPVVSNSSYLSVGSTYGTDSDTPSIATGKGWIIYT